VIPDHLGTVRVSTVYEAAEVVIPLFVVDNFDAQHSKQTIFRRPTPIEARNLRGRRPWVSSRRKVRIGPSKHRAGRRSLHECF
jgi:hypothetical protein